MSDILQRLRLLVPSDSSGAAIEAADEITRLRARVETLETFAKAFGESSMYYPGCGCHICEKYRAALGDTP